MPRIHAAPGVEYFLELAFDTRDGHEVAWEQFQLPNESPKTASGSTKPGLSINSSKALSVSWSWPTIRAS